MLLPSALTCDSSRRSNNSHSLFASPPLSPTLTASSFSTSSSSSRPAISNLLTTCRALQSMLTTPSQLPSPPTATISLGASPTPTKLRLRARKTPSPGDSKRITRRAPPRGVNKRRRALDDDPSRAVDDNEASDTCDDEHQPAGLGGPNTQQQQPLPSTPKRMRISPEVLPLGLERGDFHTLHLHVAENEQLMESVERDDHGSGDGDDGQWSSEEDRLLVELVLEKLKLTKSEWQDCARSLGRDRASVGKRWKSLMGAGDVGLKGSRSRSRRTGIHATWR